MVPVVIILLVFCWELGGGAAVINAGLMDPVTSCSRHTSGMARE